MPKLVVIICDRLDLEDNYHINYKDFRFYFLRFKDWQKTKKTDAVGKPHQP
ncbi:TPA: hypothetical protein U3S56_000490 [Streptococcus agalactiae]|nr:hypothetical protein [Streptococcus agalactiae]